MDTYDKEYDQYRDFLVNPGQSKHSRSEELRESMKQWAAALGNMNETGSDSKRIGKRNLFRLRIYSNYGVAAPKI